MYLDITIVINESCYLLTSIHRLSDDSDASSVRWRDHRISSESCPISLFQADSEGGQRLNQTTLLPQVLGTLCFLAQRVAFRFPERSETSRDDIHQSGRFASESELEKHCRRPKCPDRAVALESKLPPQHSA